MKLSDGTILMHGKRPYDPAKARAYYLRTRHLKGRKKAVPKPTSQQTANQIRYRAALDKFLKSLPMAIEGADLKTTEKFVDSMRGKTDAELRAEAEKIKREKGNNDGAQVATIKALLENRNRVRSMKADAKKTAKKTVDLRRSSPTKTG